MKIFRQFQLLLTTLLFSLAVTVFAHDTWLIPEQFTVDSDASVSLDMSSGMNFPTPLSAIKPERIEHALFRLGGHQFDLSNKIVTAKSLRFNTKLTELGIAAFWVELKPRTIELSAKKVQNYLHEIGADESILKEWNKSKKNKRWRETYTKHAKTFVNVAKNTADTSAWSEPVGMFLEIVPETNPTTLKAGDDLSVKLLKQGQVMRNFPIGLVHESSQKGQFAKTDEQGTVKFHLEKSGRWMVRSTELRKSTQPGIEWESSFTTLSLQVGVK